VLERSVVHELADRRPGCGCHLDQVEVGFLGQPERIIDAYDPHLLAGRADKPDFGTPDALVNAWFDADVTSLALLFIPAPALAGTADPPVVPPPQACRRTQKAPHAAHAEPTLPVSVTGPCGAARTQTRNATPRH